MKIKWQTPEFEYKKRSADWFWSLWIIALGAIIVSVIFGNATLAILLFLIAFVLSLQAVKKPKIINIELNETGILIKNKPLHYKAIESYDFDEDEKNILLKLKNTFSPLITIPISKETNTDDIDKFLEHFIKREQIEEPLINKLEKYL